MHRHVTTGDGMRKNGLIRKALFMGQLRQDAWLDDDWP